MTKAPTTTQTTAGPSKQAQMEAMLKLLGLTKDGTDFLEVEVVRREGQIGLPPGMSYDEAILWLTRKRDADEKQVKLVERIEGFPLDVANALFVAIKDRYGFHEAKATQGFFGPQPPQFVTIPTDAIGGTTTILIGNFQLPGIEGVFATAPDDSTALNLVATVKQKHKAEVTQLAALTREKLSQFSLYRGKAIKIDSQVQVNGMVMPTFINVNVGREEIMLNADVRAMIEAAIWNPIMYSEACLEIGAPLNGGALLEGNYGTGKTLCAAHTARICMNEEWTYVYCPRPDDLIYVYNTARQWQSPTKGVVVFVEDIDRLADNDSMVKQLSIVLDGVDNKDNKLLLVASTNHVDQVPQILRRSKRIGHTIHFSEPDAETIKLMVQHNAVNLRTGKSLLALDIDWQVVTQALAGSVAATIKDVVDTAKKRAVKRQPLVITTDDLVSVAKQVFRAAPPKSEPTSAEKLESALVATMSKAFFGSEQDKDLDDVYEQTEQANARLVRLREQVSEIQPADYSEELEALKAQGNRTYALVDSVDDKVIAIKDRLD